MTIPMPQTPARATLINGSTVDPRLGAIRQGHSDDGRHFSCPPFLVNP